MAVLSFLGTILTFCFQTICSHLMDVTEYGKLGVWLTNIGYLGMFFILGLDSSILYHAKKGESYEENMGKNFVCYFSIFFIACIGVLSLGLDYLYYIPLFISILCLAISSVFKSYFHFHEEYLWYNLLNLVLPLGLTLSFGGLLLYKIDIIAYNSYLLYSAVSFVALIFSSIKYFSVSGIKFRVSNIFSNFYYFVYGIKSVLNTVLSLTLYASSIYCIRYLGSEDMVAYFFVASSISKLVWVLPDSAGNVLYPRFLKIGTLYSKESIKGEMFFYARIVFLLNILAVISFYLIGSYIISLLYTSDYKVVFVPIIILLIGNQGMVYFKLLSRYLAAENNWKPLYFALIVGVILNIVLNIVLIPIYGLNGTAIATAVSFLGCGFTISYFVNGSLFGFINLYQLINKKI